MRALREYTVVVAVGAADWASTEASAPQNIARIRIALVVLASRNILLKM
jgi:regulation of enolase protein 1 (concanavalin A-like superfamily)